MEEYEARSPVWAPTTCRSERRRAT